MAGGLFLNDMFPSPTLSHADASEKLLDQERERVAPFAAHALALQATSQHRH